MKVRKIIQFLSHPLFKRLCIGVPLAFAAQFISTQYLGAQYWIHLLVICLLSGVVAMWIADYIFSTQAERGARRKQVATLWRESKLKLLYLGLFVGLYVIFFSGSVEPQEKAVVEIYTWVKFFGFLMVFIYPLMRSIVGIGIQDLREGLAPVMSRIVRQLVAYTMALGVIRKNGDDVFLWVSGNPQETYMVLTTVAILWVIHYFSGSPSENEHRVASTAGVAVSIRPRPTERDQRFTAAHEAGHALAYAALGWLPAGTRAAVNDAPDQNGVLGYVTAIPLQDQLANQALAEWMMLVLLAGKLGEKRVMGESTLGAQNDHVRWIELAKSYLSIQYQGLFYPAPADKYEHEWNAQRLEALQADQLHLLGELFDLNGDVHKDLADALFEQRTLERDALYSFLQRVVLPEGFPKPHGPFETLQAKGPDEK